MKVPDEVKLLFLFSFTQKTASAFSTTLLHTPGCQTWGTTEQ